MTQAFFHAIRRLRLLLIGLVLYAALLVFGIGMIDAGFAWITSLSRHGLSALLALLFAVP
jgi:hypothetical protein